MFASSSGSTSLHRVSPPMEIGPFQFMLRYLQNHNKSTTKDSNNTPRKWPESSRPEREPSKNSGGGNPWNMSTVESKGQCFRCTVCDCDFYSYSELEEHNKSKSHAFNKAQKLASNLKFICKECNIRFETLIDLKDHLNGKTHAYQAAQKLAERFERNKILLYQESVLKISH